MYSLNIHHKAKVQYFPINFKIILKSEFMAQFKNFVKKNASKTWFGNLWYARIREIYEKIELARISDESYIRTTYKNRFGREIDLKDPKTYTEKLQWLKLFYRNDKMPICTDKYAVHQYLEHLGYNHLLNKILGIYKNADLIDFESLPQSFVAKTTHGCGQNLICKDKNDINWERWRKVMNSWLKLNQHAFGREWNYENIPPRIIVEKLIEYQPLLDYKFMCFNGEPKYLQINTVEDEKPYVDFYDIHWSKLDFTYQRFRQSRGTIPIPPNFKEMKDIARKLSAPFPFTRVDLYNPPGQIIFGELTFFPGSGLLPLVPLKNGYDKKLGADLVLPNPNNNLELYKKIHH